MIFQILVYDKCHDLSRVTLVRAPRQVTTPTLTGLDFAVDEGTLTCVVGPIGSGKSRCFPPHRPDRATRPGALTENLYQWPGRGPRFGPTRCDVRCRSLLAGLLAEMNVSKTDESKAIFGYCLKGSTAYLAQSAWIQNLTVRENILFGMPYDADKYNRIVEACALGPDLQILRGGDAAEIGEAGKRNIDTLTSFNQLWKSNQS